MLLTQGGVIQITARHALQVLINAAINNDHALRRVLRQLQRLIHQRLVVDCLATAHAGIGGKQHFRPGVVNALGVWWRKLGAAGTNVNEVTHQRLTDLGCGPAFYDCLVDVQRA